MGLGCVRAVLPCPPTPSPFPLPAAPLPAVHPPPLPSCLPQAGCRVHREGEGVQGAEFSLENRPWDERQHSL